MPVYWVTQFGVRTGLPHLAPDLDQIRARLWFTRPPRRRFTGLAPEKVLVYVGFDLSYEAILKFKHAAGTVD